MSTFSTLKNVAVRSATKTRPQAWRVRLDGQDWQDVTPLMGRFLMSVANWSGKTWYSYNRTPSGGDGPANWYVVYVQGENRLGDLLNEDPASLPITPHPTGQAMWANVHIEVLEEYVSRFFFRPQGVCR